MKKQIYILLAAVMLTACAKENTTPEYTSAAVTETTVPTTALTLTESFTTENFDEPKPERQAIELAVYDPFADAVKVDDETREELTEALKKILDGFAFFCAYPNSFYKGSEYENSFADTDTVLETNPKNGFCYSPLNPDIAKTEDELIEYFRSVLSEKYMGENYEENLRERIFNEGLPYYKTIDGTLCMIVKPREDTERITEPDKFILLEYGGNSAELLIETRYRESGKYFSHMKITKYEEYGWRLDSNGGFEYDEFRMNCLHTLLLNRNKLNDILSGLTDKATPVDIGGEEYYPSSVNMSIEEMRQFFTDIFNDESLASANDLKDGQVGDTLRENYIRKYIDDVYAEYEDVLYRKVDAPEWYLPEMRIYPAAFITKDESTNSFTTVVNVDGEFQPITVNYKTLLGGLEFLHFASGLPIKEK